MPIKRHYNFAFWTVFCFIVSVSPRYVGGADGSKYAHSDGDARFLHQIHLYDSSGKRIDGDSTTPYSTVKTCGRCHDYETISHGWHFNAFLKDSVDGREGEPWIWADPRTGTQLPLSYRDETQSFDPRELGINQWEMVKQFGGRIPGGPIGSAPGADLSGDDNTKESEEDVSDTALRWPITGSLDIDCLACHGVSGSYDFNLRREQIAKENFAWASTAALRMGSIDGDVSRIKTGSDLTDESVQKKIPRVTYDGSKFAADGTVFIDLVRKPQNNACYQCHSQRTIDEHGIAARWTHDQDVHLRAGMQCVDCHRNGIDHHIVRGFPDELHPSGENMVTLSCAGCHLGATFAGEHSSREQADEIEGDDAQIDTEQLPGRLGSPLPAHAGLPPLHFEKLSCTACHSGPLPRPEALGIMTSLAHSLGEKGHRSGSELPRMIGPVYAKRKDGRIYPHRAVWPAFWGTVDSGKLTPLAPQKVYDITRRSLRVRNDFVQEILQPKPKSGDLKEWLGEERYRVKPEEWTDAEAAKVEAAVRELGKVQFAEKVSAALEAIEKETGAGQAVYVSAGFVYSKGDEDDSIQMIESPDPDAIDMIAWPLAHNVRPAGWSLGVKGCTECHQDEGPIFASTVAAVGPGPDTGEPISMASIQGVDPNQRLTWNQLFQNRASFKYVISGSIGLLVVALLLLIGLLIGRIGMKGFVKT